MVKQQTLFVYYKEKLRNSNFNKYVNIYLKTIYKVLNKKLIKRQFKL